MIPLFGFGNKTEKEKASFAGNATIAVTYRMKV
jgi:hypothetical protein